MESMFALRRIPKLLPPLIAMAAVVGSVCAFFLWSLDAVTGIRFSHPWLLYFLPVAGVVVIWVYGKFGRDCEGGTSLIMGEIDEPRTGVPRAMAPLVLFGTLMTHLCGGSAGREGTAVQMGGSIAGWLSRAAKLEPAQVRMMLMGGVAAGFGAVFGTPFAGALFAVKVARFRVESLGPCLASALVGDWVCDAWGTVHTHYVVGGAFTLSPWLAGKMVFAAVVFGLAARFYCAVSHSASGFMKRAAPSAMLRSVLGGVLVIALFFVAGTGDYLGLGVWSRDASAVTISSFFTSPEIHPWSWVWKLVFTVVTLSAGFKGGEFTPLFFIGAALGNALAGLCSAPPDLFAALGFAAVFAGAAKSPLASTVMALELFGPTHGIYLAAACFIARAVSGKSSIFVSPTDK